MLVNYLYPQPLPARTLDHREAANGTHEQFVKMGKENFIIFQSPPPQ